MNELSSTLKSKNVFIAFVLFACLTILVLYKDTIVEPSYGYLGFPTNGAFLTNETFNEESKYLVLSPKCKMPDLEPFNEQAKAFYHSFSYISCSPKPLLTSVQIINNTAILLVNSSAATSYAKSGVSCCYSSVTRLKQQKNPDVSIKIEPHCHPFGQNVTLDRETVVVKCRSKITKSHTVYENAHTYVLPRKNFKHASSLNFESRPLSVLLVGIDSISRLNFLRNLPKTRAFVEENKWVPLKGYNKIADNTFPNLIAILTGFNNSHAYQICNPKKVGYLDKCAFIWKKFRKAGYVTGYAEDEAWINTFNYYKKGFTDPPTDFYFRPYMLAAETLKRTKLYGLSYCTGPETSGERIMNLARDFSINLKDYPNFGLFWMNTFSHNDVNEVSAMDYKLRQLLRDLHTHGVVNNSIVIFFSDHGTRFGEIRYTFTGWLEERLPFLYVSFPDWFKEQFAEEYNNFRENSHRLTTPYDLHMTLQHILVLSGSNGTIDPSDGCPKCKSLFTNIEPNRSCEDAAIEQHWCTCADYVPVDKNLRIIQFAAKYLIFEIHENIHKTHGDRKCAKYSLKKVLTSYMSKPFSYKNETYILLVIQTTPSAVFEATFLPKEENNVTTFSILGGISRLDSYSSHSHCVSDDYLKMYCYCIR